MPVTILSGVDLVVEIAPGADPADPVASWPWVEITDQVLVDAGITIEAGRADESTQTDPGKCTLVLDNSSGDFCRTNPLGAHYPDLTRSTPLRVTVDGSVRFLGRITEWPPRWDKSGNFATAEVTANGPLRRLGQGATPLKSVAYRTLSSPDNTSTMVAYWPLEEESGATSVSSPVNGVRTPVITGEIDFGSDTSSASSERLLRFGDDGQLLFTVPFYSSNEHKIISLWNLPDTPLPDETILLRVYCTDGSIGWFDVVFSTPMALRLDWYRQGVLVDSTNGVDWTGYIDGGEFFMSVELTQGASIGVLVLIVEVETGDTATSSDTVSGTQLVGRIERIAAGHGNPDGASFGQLAIGNDTSAFPNYISPVNGALGTQGFAGERAAHRIERLCGEEGIDITITGDASETVTMAAQGADTLLDLLRQCEVADDGLLIEDTNGLEYQTHTHRYNASHSMVLDFDSGHIAETPTPADDDQRLRNDVTVARDGGSSARYEATGDYAPTGPIGRYDEALTIRTDTDTILPRHAEWRVHLGTVDELRWPQLDLNLASTPSLINDWLICGVGSRFTVANPPAEVGPADLDLFIEGYVEQVGYRIWRVAMNCSPASPWTAAVIEGTGPPEEPEWILDSANSSLAENIDTDDLVFDVGISFDPGWTTSAGNFPFDVEIGGEQITISSISGAGVTFTFTASARSVNGAVKSHTTGTPVRLWKPPVLSRS